MDTQTDVVEQTDILVTMLRENGQALYNMLNECPTSHTETECDQVVTMLRENGQALYDMLHEQANAYDPENPFAGDMDNGELYMLSSDDSEE